MKKIISVFVLITTLTACKKVITIDLNSKDPQLVIEGNITNIVGSYEIKISKTVNFNDGNSFSAVTDAVVVISDNSGNNETLTPTAPGIYKTTTLIGTPGRTYNLTVTTNGKTYTANSTMPSVVVMDGLILVGDPFNKDLTVNSVSTPVFQDPLGKGNYYRFIEYRNNKRVEGILLLDDELSDGNLINFPLFSTDSKRAIGDSLLVVMHCIDKQVYSYFNTIPIANGGVPANPESNIIGGCLGYFSAHTVDFKKIQIQ